jgi:hypothetical protein
MPAGYLTGEAPAEPAKLMAEFRQALELDGPECPYCTARPRYLATAVRTRTCLSVRCVTAMRRDEERLSGRWPFPVRWSHTESRVHVGRPT